MMTAAMWLPLLVVCSLSCASAHNEALSAASTNFAWDLTSELAKSEKGNVVVSPLSISTLLAMLQQGARNETSKQLEQVLHIDPANSREGYGQLVQHLTKPKYKSKLEFNSKIFSSSEFGINPNFASVLHTSFNAGVETLDFKNSVYSAGRINDWVAYSTKNRITNLVKPGSLSSRTQMVLANTIYFKGVWRQLFPVEKTVDEDFTTSSGRKVKVPMMQLKSLMRAGASDALGADWLEIPYDGFDFSMVLVLPYQNKTLNSVLGKVNNKLFEQFMENLYTKDITLKMPRFKLSQEVAVIPALKKLGLVDIFDQRSNLAGVSISGSNLLVSDIVHKAEIEVNEAGTEAAASSVYFAETLSFTPDYELVDFFVNRPFLLMIVDTVNKLPVFVAKVVDPTSE